jgi:hypothetical protein
MTDYAENFFDLTKYTKQFYKQALNNNWEAAYSNMTNIMQTAEQLALKTRDKYVEQVRKATL